jgi:hypothetical protein
MPIYPVVEADWREVSLLPFTEATKDRNFIDELEFLNGRAVFRRVTYRRACARPAAPESPPDDPLFSSRWRDVPFARCTPHGRECAGNMLHRFGIRQRFVCPPIQCTKSQLGGRRALLCSNPQVMRRILVDQRGV